jgi:hypothetical protein
VRCVMYEPSWPAVAAGLPMNYKLREMETQGPLVAQNTAEISREHHGNLS